MSSEEQARGSSLQDQQDAIGAYAKGLGFKVAHFYVEAESAVHEKIERREQIRALMEDVREGDLIVCAKLDRWSRDPELTYGSVRQILERRAAVYFVDERCDPSTSEGDSAMGFRILFAREEHKRIKERMVGTRKLLRDRGYYVEGLPPIGYRRAHPKGYKGAEKNILAIDEPGAELVRRAFQLCIAGHSLAKIGTAGGMSREQAASALRNRLYLGEIEDSRGAWIRGKQAPIIDPETFARAQVALDARRLGGPKPREAPSGTSTWILRDVVVCVHCGARMASAYSGRVDLRRHYYKCSKRCTSRYVPVGEVEAAAGPLVLARLEALREALSREPKQATKPAVVDLAPRRAKLARRRARCLEAFTDEMMTREELGRALAKLDAEGTRLDGEEQAARRPSPLADPKTRRAALRGVGAIRRAWTRASPEARREIVRQLASAARIGEGPPRFDWRSAAELAERG